MFDSSTHLHEFFESMISSSKASVSVILVLLYGYLLRKGEYISKEGERNISQIGTTFLLPALLFSEIGPLATFSALRTYWPIIPLTLFFQLISLLVGIASHKIGGMSRHYVPIFVFNNVTSLPLLLITALASTGSLDELVPVGDLLADVVSRGRVYILINALVGNLTRFAFGPYLMITHERHFWESPYVDDPNHDNTAKYGTITLQDSESEQTGQDTPFYLRALSRLKRIGSSILGFLNPPLIGAGFAIIFGVVPFLHHQFFEPSGIFTPIANSIDSVGSLYTALQMLVLGAHLYSKKGTSASSTALAWLFIYRFLIAPAISIGTVVAIRRAWPGLIKNDPILDFVLSISNTGPPALTLSAIAEISGISADLEGQIAKIITISYVCTPLIAFPVTAALAVVRELSEGHW